MYKLPVFEVEELPDEVFESFNRWVQSNETCKHQDYIEWPLELTTSKRRSLSEELYEDYKVVLYYFLDTIDLSDINTVLIRTY